MCFGGRLPGQDDRGVTSRGERKPRGSIADGQREYCSQSKALPICKSLLMNQFQFLEIELSLQQLFYDTSLASTTVEPGIRNFGSRALP